MVTTKKILKPLVYDIKVRAYKHWFSHKNHLINLLILKLGTDQE